MDQSVVAGIGNIYRAEVLFKAGVHPEQPGRTMPRAAFDTLWAHSVALLRRGFQTGSILTVDPEEAARLGAPWTRRCVWSLVVDEPGRAGGRWTWRGVGGKRGAGAPPGWGVCGGGGPFTQARWARWRAAGLVG